MALTRRSFIYVAGAGALAAPFSQKVRAAVTLKIGILLPRSGKQADLGIDCQRGADVALEVLSKRGYPNFEFLPADTETKEAIARAQAEKLIDQGAHVLVGCFDSGQTIAAGQVCEQKGIPLVVNIAAVPSLTERGWKTIFRLFPTAIQTTKDSFEQQKMLFQMTGVVPKTATLLYIHDSLGGPRRDALVKLAPEFQMPYSVVDTVGYHPGAFDLSAEVRKVKSIGADLLFVVTRLNDGILVCQEMVKQRFSPMGIISLGPGWYEVPFMRALGKYSDDAISTIAWHDPRKPLAQELDRAFKAKYPKLELNTNHTYTFEAILVAVDAFRRAGSTEAGKLIEALRTTDIAENVVTGPGVKFDQKGQREGGGASTIQNLGGKNTVVLPESVAVRKPTWPMRPWSDRI